MSEKTNRSIDQSHRFYFEDGFVRGEVVTINESFVAATEHQDNHPVLQKLLGEFFAAINLLTGILKFDGLLILQVRGDGAVPLVMAETTNNKKMRGIIKADPEVDLDKLNPQSIQDLLGQGVLSITIDPTRGDRYQGIVSLEGETLADCLNNYFKQSEQLPTQVWLCSDEQTAAGLLIQALPDDGNSEQAKDEWDSAQQLAGTIKQQELLELDHETILYRLFNEFKTRISSAEKITFHCSCSRDRSKNALSAINREEAYELLEEQGIINIDCQFCGKNYQFDKKDLDGIFSVNTKLH